MAIAARASVAEELRVTYWKLRDEGSYKDKKAPDGKRRALTRVLGAEVVLRQPVAFLGDRVKVLCVHFHRMPAKKEKGFTDAYKKFWPYLKEVLTQEKTQVLFGDFNMSLWRVVPELRLLGVKVTLVAWFPWKSSLQGAGQGKPMCDSCGIFVVGQEVAARLQTAVADLHDDDERGWLWRGVSQSYAAVEAFQDGPGQALECYLHKSDALRERVRPSLAYSEGGAKAAVAGVLRLREKRLDMDVWLGQNKIRMKGAHFPLCVFTHNGRRRSEEAQERRQLKRGQKSKQKSQRGVEEHRSRRSPQTAWSGQSALTAWSADEWNEWRRAQDWWSFAEWQRAQEWARWAGFWSAQDWQGWTKWQSPQEEADRDHVMVGAADENRPLSKWHPAVADALKDTN